MKNKNTIRLTESELKQVISESVKQVISELDWKTYANAAKKRFAQGNNMAGLDLQDYATQQFNKEHGKKEMIYNADGSTDIASTGLNDGSVRKTWRGRPGTYTEVSPEGNEVTYKEDPYSWQRKRIDGHRGIVDKNLQHAHNEYNNYINGNYQYSQNKGWNLKK